MQRPFVALLPTRLRRCQTNTRIVWHHRRVGKGATQPLSILSLRARRLYPPYDFLLLKIRRHFLLLEVGSEIFLNRDIDEGRPDRRLRRIGIEVLVLDAAR